MALAGVVTGGLFVEAGWPLGAEHGGGAARRPRVGPAQRRRSSIARAAPAVHRDARASWASRAAPPSSSPRGATSTSRAGSSAAGGRSACRPTGSRRSSCSLLAVVFQVADDPLPVGTRRVRRSAATRRRRSSPASRSGASRRRSTCSAACSPRSPASCSSLVQGQGKADLATGYELDIIASAVVGGASLSGGRGSVMGAVLGTLIFGVLRNALPQIPGATFYDRLIVGARRHRHRRDGPDVVEEGGVSVRLSSEATRTRCS